MAGKGRGGRLAIIGTYCECPLFISPLPPLFPSSHSLRGDCPLSRAISTTLEKNWDPFAASVFPSAGLSSPPSIPRFRSFLPSSLPPALPSLRPFPPLSHQAANRTDIQRKVGWSDPPFSPPYPPFARLGRPRRRRRTPAGEWRATRRRRSGRGRAVRKMERKEQRGGRVEGRTSLLKMWRKARGGGKFD